MLVTRKKRLLNVGRLLFISNIFSRYFKKYWLWECIIIFKF